MTRSPIRPTVLLSLLLTSALGCSGEPLPVDRGTGTASPDDSGTVVTDGGSTTGDGGSTTTDGGTTDGGSSEGGTVDEPFEGEPGTVMFVTQVPTCRGGDVTRGGNVAGVADAFGNNATGVNAAPRGGSLWIRYADGNMRNLTHEAGYGEEDDFQGSDAIAVRQPSVHWSGNRALFSMLIGSPELHGELDRTTWQIYEVTGLGRDQTAVITRVEGQPETASNLSPIYGSDDSILFTSDRAWNGQEHLHPLDEYESSPTVNGIYALRTDGQLELLEHAPSGAYDLSIDSYGRVLFTKWDHLQRDQQADSPLANDTYSPVTYADESEDAVQAPAVFEDEPFPEARTGGDESYVEGRSLHTFNHFLPWQMNEDGSDEETLIHLGRHELGGSGLAPAFPKDDSLSDEVPDGVSANSMRMSPLTGLFHVLEHPTAPGLIYATYAHENLSASGGVLVRLQAHPDQDPEAVDMQGLTSLAGDGDPLGRDDTYRNPTPLSDGSFVAVFTQGNESCKNVGTIPEPVFNYAYRLHWMDQADDGTLSLGEPLTEGSVRPLQWWDGAEVVDWRGRLWELDPVEVAPRSRPETRVTALPEIEQQVFTDSGVDIDVFTSWLAENDRALLVSRNVTQRDRADIQQPFNLRVPGGVESIADGGPVYEVEHLQFFQADYVRGYVGDDTSDIRRRTLPRPMHGELVSGVDALDGAVEIEADGSIAAIVPARRALSWQLTDSDHSGVVIERNWVSFAPGEIRVCTACHGINSQSQTGQSSPENPPQALVELLESWAAER